MRVKHGWSGEVSTNRWAKVDVELDDEDLRRLVKERTGLGVEALAHLSHSAAFSLLESEAERLLYIKLCQRHGMDKDTVRGLCKEILDMQNGICAALRKNLGAA